MILGSRTVRMSDAVTMRMCDDVDASRLSAPLWWHVGLQRLRIAEMRQPNAQYNVARPGALAVRIATRVRAKMYRDFIDQSAVSSHDTILDVGVTSDQSYASSNYLEALHPYKDKITACGIEDATFLERLYPGVQFVFGNGLNLPFEDAAFDFVHSSAVLEHVGNYANQRRFIHECAARTVGGYRIDVRDRRLLGWPSNLLLVGKRLAL
jgi:SAM-dependent methyltransferase